MIIIKNGTLERVKDWTDDSIYVLTDFDRTITVGNSESSWSILSKSNVVPKEYIEERQELFDYYRPIEIDETLDYDTKSKLMTEWWNKHIGLFVKYRLSEEVINNAAQNLRVMSFRDGAREFLKNMKDRNIPVIIISAGIGNFIEQFLIKNNCNFDNIYIVSNFLKFENGIATGVSDNVIHSLNKNEVSLPNNIKELIENRKNIILLGDSTSDIRMAREEARNQALKIGFLEEKVEENKTYYQEQFDVVCTGNTTYNELFQKLPILKK
ncbi:MAG: HAD-IB family phosphatase [Bacilli bacterium]|nr:HAD-IB family phosphatase [Bacilli bacterium]